MPADTRLRDDEALLLTYFTGNGESGLKMAWGRDGYTFAALNKGKGFWECTIGEQKLVRDPCFSVGPDGTVHFVWTTGWKEPCFGYIRTRDFKTWSPQKLITPFGPDEKPQNCWAPEITFDAELGHFMIYWSTTLPTNTNKIEGDDKNHRIFYTITTDFEHFSPTKMLYDPGFNVIDASIVRDPDTDRWLMFVKDERKVPQAKKNLYIAASGKLEGPYEKIVEPFTGRQWAEGPTAQKIGDRWFCWFDRYGNHEYALMTSSDLKTWTEETGALSTPQGVRHFTVGRVPRALIEAIAN